MERNELRLVTTGAMLTASILASIGIRRLIKEAAAAGEQTQNSHTDHGRRAQAHQLGQIHIEDHELDRLPLPTPDYSRKEPTLKTNFSGTQSQRGDDSDLMADLITGARRITDQLNTGQQG